MPVNIKESQLVKNRNLSRLTANLSRQTGLVSYKNLSRPAKNRNLSRLISNLSRLNWSSQRNCVYCFSTVFTLLQQQELPSICLPRNLPCLDFESFTLLPILDCTLVSNTPLLFFTINTILHTRLSFGIVHSIMIYPTISKITVRPREIGTGGTLNHDSEAHRGADSVFYSLM